MESDQIRVAAPLDPIFETILSPEALGFVTSISRHFSNRLDALLKRRIEVRARIRNGRLPTFLEETKSIRESSWSIAPIPPRLQKRWVEITGPVDRKMMINALNSGADVFMADFEDSHSPTWRGNVQGQLNLKDALEGTIEYTSPEGKRYTLHQDVATLSVRPRGLHLVEKHFLVDGKPVPAPFFDFGLYLFGNRRKLMDYGPIFYLPKLESHLEARLWNDVFDFSAKQLGIPSNSIKCTVLIETILAAFEMDEILHELRNHITALNFGRWDYMFSFIKILGQNPTFLLPDRSQLTMTTHFMKSCSLLLVQTCHKRNAYAIGGMAAQVPIRNNPQAQAEAVEKVTADKLREISQGYDGTWVAHPDLVPIVMKIFQEKMQGTNQLNIGRQGLKITEADLLTVPSGQITEAGLRSNIAISIRYLASWLSGSGAVAINNLMEDAATVEISRSQIWQWIRHKAKLPDGRTITPELFHQVLSQELERAKEEVGEENFRTYRFGTAAELLEKITANDEFIEFMPALAYDYLD